MNMYTLCWFHPVAAWKICGLRKIPKH